MSRYYVYELIDPRDGTVFYVGKGCRGRVNQHERDARTGGIGPKCDRIRAIWRDGFKVQKHIVRRFAIEQEAYDFETARIAEVGINNLTNIMLGFGRGYGPQPWAWDKRSARGVAARLAAALKLVCGGYRILLGPYDLSEGVKIVLGTLARDLGREYVARLLRPHGILMV